MSCRPARRLPGERARASSAAHNLTHGSEGLGATESPRPVPDEPVHVRLTGPGGETWTFGPADAANAVTGPALDFCLLVTQRRHRNDLALAIEGPAAIEWMAIAQAFAGTAGTGRPPRRSADD